MSDQMCLQHKHFPSYYFIEIQRHGFLQTYICHSPQGFNVQSITLHSHLPTEYLIYCFSYSIFRLRFEHFLQSVFK